MYATPLRASIVPPTLKATATQRRCHTNCDGNGYRRDILNAGTDGNRNTIAHTDCISNWTATATPTAGQQQPHRAIPSGAARLLLPADGATVTGSTQFRWESDARLTDGQNYEVVFWKQGQDPIRDGFGIAAPTNNTEITVNLTKLDDNIDHPLEPGDYQWGLLIVSGQGDEYRTADCLAFTSLVRYERSSSGGGGSGPSGYP